MKRYKECPDYGKYAAQHLLELIAADYDKIKEKSFSIPEKKNSKIPELASADKWFQDLISHVSRAPKFIDNQIDNQEINKIYKDFRVHLSKDKRDFKDIKDDMSFSFNMDYEPGHDITEDEIKKMRTVIYGGEIGEDADRNVFNNGAFLSQEMLAEAAEEYGEELTGKFKRKWKTFNKEVIKRMEKDHKI